MTLENSLQYNTIINLFYTAGHGESIPPSGLDTENLLEVLYEIWPTSFPPLPNILALYYNWADISELGGEKPRLHPRLLGPYPLTSPTPYGSWDPLPLHLTMPPRLLGPPLLHFTTIHGSWELRPYPSHLTSPWDLTQLPSSPCHYPSENTLPFTSIAHGTMYTHSALHLIGPYPFKI